MTGSGHWGLVLLAATALQAAAAGVTRDQVMGLLQGYEWQIDRPVFDALGSGADQALIAVAEDEALMSLYRDRAVAALSLYSSDRVWTFFEGRIRHAEDPVQRRRAVDSACDAFAGQRNPALELLLTPLLESEDVHLRIRAARCLHRIAGADAQRALLHYREQIDAAWERRAAGFKEDRHID